jgi:tocopherol O-methyltransferase
MFVTNGSPNIAPTPSQIAGHYNALDSFYRRVWGAHVHHGLWKNGKEPVENAMRQLIEFVAEKARIGRGSRICDIGCGYGATAKMLARERGAEVTGITISSAQFHFAIAENNSANNPKFLLGDWLENKLPGENFDALVAIESSEHIVDKRAFFSQAHRVLRAGGCIVFCGWLANENVSHVSHRLLLEPIARESLMEKLGTESEYRALLASTGFAIESFDDLSAHVKKTWPVKVRQFLFHLCRHPRDVRFLFGKHRGNRIFARTVLRIMLGFRTGALRYGVFAASKM